MDIVEAESRSPTRRRVHSAILLLWRPIFLHLSCILQNVALITIQTPEGALRVPFLALAISKLAIKGAVFLVEGRKISEMWEKLKDEGIRTKNLREMK